MEVMETEWVIGLQAISIVGCLLAFGSLICFVPSAPEGAPFRSRLSFMMQSSRRADYLGNTPSFDEYCVMRFLHR